MSVRPHAPGSDSAAAGGAGSGWAVLDSGLKAQSTDSGLPVLVCDAREYHGLPRDTMKDGSPAAGAADIAAATAAAASAASATAPLPSALPLRVLPSAAGGGPQGVFASSVGHLVVKGVSDEHSTIVPRPGFASEYGAGAAAPAYLPPLGSKLLLMPGHCDPFVNHFDWMVGVRRSGEGAHLAEAAAAVAAVAGAGAGGSGSGSACLGASESGKAVVAHVWRIAARSPGI